MYKIVLFLFLFLLFSCSDLQIDKIDCSNGEKCPENSSCIDGYCSLDKVEDIKNYSCLDDDCENKAIKWSELNSLHDQSGNIVVLDKENNIYVVGFEGIKEHYSVYISKFNENYKELWTKIHQTDSNDVPRSAKINEDNELYIIGHTTGQVGGTSNKGEEDIFFLKVDSNNGEILSDYQWGTTKSDIGNDLGFDKLGNAYVLGTTKGRLNGKILVGESDIFLSKFDKDGKLLDTKLFGTAKEELGISLFIAKDAIYITGATKGVLGDILGDEAPFDIVVFKLDFDLSEVWSKQFGTDKGDVPTSIKVDKDENIYISGDTADKFSDEIDGDKHIGVFDSLLFKLNGDGDLLWTRQWGSEDNDFAYTLEIFDDYIYAVGLTHRSLNGDSTSQDTNIDIHKFDSDGLTINYSILGTNENELPKSIFYKNSYLYITGTTEGSFHGNTNVDEEDAFLLKIKLD